MEDADLPDGGVPEGTRPIASIDGVDLPCDETIVNLDGTGSEAFDGATLMSFEWTLISPSGDTIATINGSLPESIEVEHSACGPGGT